MHNESQRNALYLNYASTTPRLNPQVAEALQQYLTEEHLNAGRNFEGLADAGIALEAREAVASLFHAPKGSQVVFTSGITLSLNMALHGLLKPGDHALATSVEHNAVARPLHILEEMGVQVTWLACAPDGSLDPESVKAAVRPNSRVLVMPHASNVLGTILPFEACFGIAKEYGLLTILDTAQTAGVFPLSMGQNTDILAFTGHKGLGALPGIGGMVISPEGSSQIRPWIAGGTGSLSHSLQMPDALPDRLEPGTANTPGIVSLGAACKSLQWETVRSIRGHECSLTSRFLDGLRQLPLKVCGTGDARRSVAVVSVYSESYDSGLLSQDLFSRYGIVTRSGLHCSPLAHQTAGTFPQGTVRFSFGSQTTEEEIDAALKALGELLVTK